VRRALLILVATCAFAGIWTFSNALAGGSQFVPDFPVGGTNFFLPECASLKDPKRSRCYVRGLLGIVEKSGDPATELPRIDQKVHGNGGFLESNCHILMHEVGRTYAKRHGVTLETLFKYVPKSNDPGCSAGFGMGLVMHLGTQLVLEPRSVLPICAKLPTRFREYTCVHGSGHALMRGYHGRLDGAVDACRKLGPGASPDCAQGAFHDYWISLGGGDDTTRPKAADTNPRTLCARFEFARPCWYRFFWERKQSAQVDEASDLRRLCRGLTGLQRAGCISGASLLAVRNRDPFEHARLCRGLGRNDALNCFRGVSVPLLVGNRWDQLRLTRSCAKLPQASRFGCYSWFGRTINVVTNGRFEREGCPRLRIPEARVACLSGARKFGKAIGTFS
jgi:hypothetical protein